MPQKRRLLFFISLVVSVAGYCQPAFNYERAWKKVDSLFEKKGLTQSALAEVNKIYTIAKAGKNDAQVIRSLLYMSTLAQARQDDGLLKMITNLEAELSTSTEPAKSILSGILADTYWSWFGQNRWKLYGRTETANFKKDDINTWGVEDFHKRISDLFLASIRNENLLQQTRLEKFEPIILKGNMRHLRPTLFDLLAHQALQYFRTDEPDITRPAYAFEIHEAAAFDPAADFVHHRFTTRDTASLHWKALKLYQRLIAFHLQDAKPDALIDVDLDRLSFVRSYAVAENKEELYLVALKHITSQYSSVPAANQAWYLVAQWHADKAAEYQPLKNDSNRYEYVRAKEICDQVVLQKDSSEGRVNCQNLLQQIRATNLHLETEKVNLPGQPFRMLVTYRNVPNLFYRIIKVTKKIANDLGDRWEDGYWEKLARLAVLHSFEQPLPVTADYQQHKVEVKVDSLPVGEYALFASADKDFSGAENNLAVQFFYVSNIAYINHDTEYFVADRETGKPLMRANVQVWYRYYDQRADEYRQRKGENMYTDKNGFFHLEPSKTLTNNTYSVEISYQTDHLFIDNEHSYAVRMPRQKDTSATTFLFSDRSIYRPGQPIYFKGIVIKRSDERTAVITRQKTKVYLLDVNGQKSDSLEVTTNDFGSYSGKFLLPQNQLTGLFNLLDNSTQSTLQFSVEEYKRPRFSVDIKKPGGTYRLNDSIRVTGLAKAYAGNAIDGAMVKFTVMRKPRLVIFDDFVRGRKIWPPFNNRQTEIAHGEVKTNASGEFSIAFKAIPDAAVGKEEQPVFNYEINADVTDITGETRTGNTTVAVAYQALQLSIEIPARVPPDSLQSVILRSVNLNDVFEKTPVTISLYKLKMPARQWRERYWEQADQFMLTEQEYHRLFPYDLYRDENDQAKWARELRVTEVTDTTTENKGFDLGKAASGWYAIEAIAHDRYGELVKATKFVEVVATGEPSLFDVGRIVIDNPTLQPGQKGNYRVNTGWDSAWVIHTIAQGDNTQQRTGMITGKQPSKFEMIASDADGGSIALSMAFIRHNRIYNDQLMVPVRDSKKELSIHFITYRDKTLPGSEEQWKIRITGSNSDKAAAEVLTAMYDASLDQFRPHGWSIPTFWNQGTYPFVYSADDCFGEVASEDKEIFRPGVDLNKIYDVLGLYDNRGRSGLINVDARRSYKKGEAGAFRVLAVPDLTADPDGSKGLLGNTNYSEQEQSIKITPPAAVQVRRDFKETAFFIPQVTTDSAGNVEFSFTMPEAVTQWKWMTLAHTRSLAFAYAEQNIVTQKQLMVQPNAPRFLREGDRMDLTTKIVNMTGTELTGQVELQLIDPASNQPVDGIFHNVFPNQYFTVEAGQSTPVSFSVEVPFQYNHPVTYRFIASTTPAGGNTISDGEEATLPVMSNRILVTESLPLTMQGSGNKQFTFKKLLASGSSETLTHHALTVEFTANPAWYAVQALPYLMEYPYECAEQVFNRYYSNALASMIANSSPRIRQVFEKWRTSDTAALLSNLEKNPELKSLLLEETPWVLEAKSETQQKKNIALLFDLVRMGNEMHGSFQKLADMQLPEGGFPWFRGATSDRYITQYIVGGIGHLKKLHAQPADAAFLTVVTRKAIVYLDKKLKEDYNYLVTHKTDLKKNNLDALQIQYLYARSFFPEYPVAADAVSARKYYLAQASQYWTSQGKYLQGMMALSLFRSGDVRAANDIVKSLKENAIRDDALGMYWKEWNTPGYYWQQAPVEAQALLIEAFREIGKDEKITNDLRTWLLQQKQTQHWETTKATADACYALLMDNGEWLSAEPQVNITLGNTSASTSDAAEAGTGYFKKVIDGESVKPEMGNIRVTVASQPQASWGAVYWQYFDNLENITTAATPLQLRKKLFVEKNTEQGPVLVPLNTGDVLKVGDKVKVRIELRIDRTLEYVHMKDMRAASLEPVNVISEYKWQGGLGYYESTRDASTNFFFGTLPKGTWVFEYALHVTHTGSFSNGITTVQCMYAPQFTSHSEGTKITVE